MAGRECDAGDRRPQSGRRTGHQPRRGVAFLSHSDAEVGGGSTAAATAPPRHPRRRRRRHLPLSDIQRPLRGDGGGAQFLRGLFHGFTSSVARLKYAMGAPPPPRRPTMPAPCRPPPPASLTLAFPRRCWQQGDDRRNCRRGAAVRRRRTRRLVHTPRKRSHFHGSDTGDSCAGRRREHTAADSCHRQRGAEGRLKGRAMTTAVRPRPHRDGFGRRAEGDDTASPTRHARVQSLPPFASVSFMAPAPGAVDAASARDTTSA